MKKKGFTLIELLAVIVVLAIIALIATPMIMNVIDKAKKGALEDSAYGLIDSANIYYTKNMMDGSIEKTTFTFEDGKQTSEQKLEYKGNVEKGSLMLFSDGKSAVCLESGKHTAVKNVDDDTVHMSTGTCEFNETTQEYETKSAEQEKIEELEKELATLKGIGDATAEDILEGKTAVVQGEEIVGALKKQGKYEEGTLTCYFGKNSLDAPAVTFMEEFDSIPTVYLYTNAAGVNGVMNALNVTQTGFTFKTWINSSTYAGDYTVRWIAVENNE